VADDQYLLSFAYSFFGSTKPLAAVCISPVTKNPRRYPFILRFNKLRSRDWLAIEVENENLDRTVRD